ncbi:MAG: helix-turn-helix domain-containing protein, partial [Bacteroidales bacterium]|nr:helix-turn-helix domain-containing protein [Bacteroidales bacterium]
MGYKHLTREQRYTIEALLQTPMSLREIGEVIGVSTGTVSRNLRHHGRRKRRRDSLYRSRGVIQDRVDISLRPSVVDEKKRFGDFEIDTMIGRNHKGAIM